MGADPSESLFLDAQIPFSAVEKKCHWSTEQVPALLWHLVPCLCQDAPAALRSAFLALHLNLLFITHTHTHIHTNYACIDTHVDIDVVVKCLHVVNTMNTHTQTICHYKLLWLNLLMHTTLITCTLNPVWVLHMQRTLIHTFLHANTHTHIHLALTPVQEHMPPQLLWESV